MLFVVMLMVMVMVMVVTVVVLVVAKRFPGLPKISAKYPGNSKQTKTKTLKALYPPACSWWNHSESSRVSHPKYSDAIRLQQVGSPKTLDHLTLLVTRGSRILGKLPASILHPPVIPEKSKIRKSYGRSLARASMTNVDQRTPKWCVS